MEAEPNHSKSLKQKAAALNALVSGPLSSSVSKLAGRSRGIPYEKDFHFYNNFAEFKSPAREVAGKSESILRSIGSSCPFRGSRAPPPFPPDLDDAYDWLVNFNDEFLERFGVSMDEFKCLREKEEESSGRIDPADSEGGFQLVYGKKKRGYVRDSEKDDGFPVPSSSAGVKVASRDTKTTAPRSKVPFHIPTIPRPQKEFNILVNNSNQPFDHVWLERSEDGSRFVHPLEKLSVLNFIDRNVEDGEPVKPLPIESTPFKLVDGVKELKELAAKLRNVNEFAVDLEHNQYRSFLGLTCLMQISTRIEDFIIDTLKLRVHVGPYLREVFKDPAKRKVMHGADRDILWLQRDFGIYVCNLFDTGQASRVMQLERNSLEYLLHHFCEVNANKEYQKADWRIRPLPEEMLKYAREDTHYLLHMYDLMKNRLLLASSSENDLLLEVYKRSYEVCMQLYEKELLTNTSYLYIYGLQEADFNSKQLAIVHGLCEWRDKIAREEDESTGYILPNKALLEIARQMPLSFGKLRRLVKSKHPYVERHVSSVVAIISSSIENSSSFESISEQLKKGRHEVFPVQNIEVASNTESLLIPEDPIEFTVDQRNVVDGASNGSTMQSIEDVAASAVAMDDDAEPSTTEVFSNQTDLVSKYQQEEKLQPVPLSDGAGAFKKEKTDNGITKSLGSVKKASIASVQISKKQTSAFGALLGNTSSRRKFNPDNGVTFEQDKNANLVAQIKSSVFLPFHTFTGEENSPEPRPETISKHPLPESPKQCLGQPPAETSKLEEVITLNDDSDGSQSSAEIPTAEDGLKHREWFPRLPENGGAEAFPAESDTAESPMSLSDLSSSFRECFQSINEMRGSKQKQTPYPEAEINFQLKPFDYAAARENMKFGEVGKEGGTEGDGDGAPPDSGERRKKGSAFGRASVEERTGGFQPPRRRQAFPLSGNRSATYR